MRDPEVDDTVNASFDRDLNVVAADRWIGETGTRLEAAIQREAAVAHVIERLSVDHHLHHKASLVAARRSSTSYARIVFWASESSRHVAQRLEASSGGRAPFDRRRSQAWWPMLCKNTS